MNFFQYQCLREGGVYQTSSNIGGILGGRGIIFYQSALQIIVSDEEIAAYSGYYLVKPYDLSGFEFEQ